jgi:cytochrome c oxidase assembly protein subunit 15
MRTEAPRTLHRFAVVLAGCVIGLIAAGGLVKSLEAGLSVPDWPTSYGGWNPPRWWQIENVRAEHGHRLIAGTVALLTMAMAVWAWRREARRWVRRLAYGAVAAVLAQALLGGLTVLFFLPTPISVSHAAVAQFYLCLVVGFAVVTSRWWCDGAPSRALASTGRELRNLATGTTILIYAQILLGAVVRHTGAGLAIPDFPRMFGRWWPPDFDFGIAIQLTHRIGAVTVTLAIATLLFRLWQRADRGGFVVPAVALGFLVVVQFVLGATVIWTARAVLPNTLHVPTGAALLATSLIFSLRAWRMAAAPPVPATAVAGSSVVTA